MNGPPQKYNWACTALLADFPLADMDVVIDRVTRSDGESGAAKKRKRGVAEVDVASKQIVAVGKLDGIGIELDDVVSDVSPVSVKRLRSVSDGGGGMVWGMRVRRRMMRV